jgi:basic membrane lipoprotein Med (substrate-binding protein (PBP1-ABC) superfamily)
MFQSTYEPIAERFGSSVEVVDTDNVPFSEEAGQITQRFIDEGADLLIDTVGLAEIFNDVCAANPEVSCLAMGQLGELPPNVKGFWVKHWVTAYVAGVTAGLLTTSNTVGFVSPFDGTLINASINSYALGCRSVNPECQIRVVVTNDYYNPPVTTQAANSLIDAGADVLKGFTDDPTYCRPAEERGVFAVPEFWDGSPLCPNAAATSTVWSLADFFGDEIEKVLSGTWTNEVEILPPSETFSLGPWAPNVPPEVTEQVEQVLADIGSGALNPWVGPISDSNGDLRVEEGEELTDEFIFGGWDWYVEGVVAG